jgi:GT2 family glycosyltransferase
MQTQPALSVVITTGQLRHLSTLALRSLIEQDMIDQMEIIIIDCVPPETPALPNSDHARVRVIRKPADFDFEQGMVLGIQESRAPIVALLEEHCITLPGWAKAMVEAHKEPWGAVCGEVLNGNPGLGLSNAEFFATRNIRWQSPAEKSQLNMIDGHNSSYKRDILLGYGERLEMMLRAEAVLLFKMQEDGYKLLLEPAAKYIHVNEASFKTLPSTLYYWHRVFGYTRAIIFEWSVVEKIKRVLMLPLLPFWHSLKTLTYIIQKRPDRLLMFFVNVPLMLVLHYAASFGQFMGLVFGEGDAAHQFSERERGVPRFPKSDLIKQ